MKTILRSLAIGALLATSTLAGAAHAEGEKFVWIRLTMRTTSVVRFSPAAWKSAGLKKIASPFSSGSWTQRSSK